MAKVRYTASALGPQPAGLEMGLEGRVVLVTGAGGGIGAAIAASLTAVGARVAVADLETEPLTQVVAGLGDVFSDSFDVADPAAFQAFHEAASRELGPIYGLVNCAGLWASSPFAELDGDRWRTVLTANLDTTFVACRAVLSGMCARQSGSIVNIASTAGEYGSVRPAAHYAAAKAGVIGLTKSLAREAGPHGVRVNALSPGPIDTPAMGLTTPEERAAFGARTLLMRPGRPDEVANGVVFLLGELASFVTGHVLRINGGALL